MEPNNYTPFEKSSDICREYNNYKSKEELPNYYNKYNFQLVNDIIAQQVEKDLQENKIIELNRKDYCNGRGMSWGKYVF
jgi:hypothetical protein